jgi:hypothetical protein
MGLPMGTPFNAYVAQRLLRLQGGEGPLAPTFLEFSVLLGQLKRFWRRHGFAAKAFAAKAQ